MNECPKMGTVLVPLNGGLWVLLVFPDGPGQLRARAQLFNLSTAIAER
jgi:hypothetical protein